MSNPQLLEFKEQIKSQSESANHAPDRQTRRLLLYLFTGTRGGYTRLRIVMLLLQKPYNTYQLSQKLEMDYKAVQHHMKVLVKNNLVSKIGEKYGALFYISSFLEYNIRALNEAIDKLEKKMNTKKVYL
ncbi:MAG: winged helix-turn-helix transcriptional regulator [Thaumarchaeota archaeon]|nr:winged helix-turn-helix transcriptional regulator [Nitrososphaerota archaeon]